MGRDDLKKEPKATKPVIVLMSGALFGLAVSAGSMYYRHINPNYDETLNKAKNTSVVNSILHDPVEGPATVSFLMAFVAMALHIPRVNRLHAEKAFYQTLLDLEDVEEKISEIQRGIAENRYDALTIEPQLQRLFFKMSELHSQLKEISIEAYNDYKNQKCRENNN